MLWFIRYFRQIVVIFLVAGWAFATYGEEARGADAEHGSRPAGMSSQETLPSADCVRLQRRARIAWQQDRKEDAFAELEQAGEVCRESVGAALVRLELRRLMNDHQQNLDQLSRIDNACDQFEQALQNGDSPQIEDVLAEHDESLQQRLREELRKVEESYRSKQIEEQKVDRPPEPPPTELKYRYQMKRKMQVAHFPAHATRLRRCRWGTLHLLHLPV